MSDKDAAAGYMIDVIKVYRRIEKAYNEGRGMKMSAAEVARVWVIDDAISTAVFSADEADAERK